MKTYWSRGNHVITAMKINHEAGFEAAHATWSLDLVLGTDVDPGLCQFFSYISFCWVSILVLSIQLKVLPSILDFESRASTIWNKNCWWFQDVCSVLWFIKRPSQSGILPRQTPACWLYSSHNGRLFTCMGDSCSIFDSQELSPNRHLLQVAAFFNVSECRQIVLTRLQLFRRDASWLGVITDHTYHREIERGVYMWTLWCTIIPSIQELNC